MSIQIKVGPGTKIEGQYRLDNLAYRIKGLELDVQVTRTRTKQPKARKKERKSMTSD